eukprot:Platyproteum_vivax@DN5605_c0_g1_i2.p1
MAKTFKGALFDLDGTMIDYEGPSHQALNAPLKKLNKAVDWDLHSKILGTPPTYWAPFILKELDITTITPDQYLDGYYDEINELYASITELEGIRDIMYGLKKKGLKIAIATSSHSHSFIKKMAIHPVLVEVADVVITGDDPEIGEGKPAPDIFLLAAKRLHLNPVDCVVFEDAPAGITAGLRAEMHVAAIRDARFQLSSSKSPEIGEAYAKAHWLVPSWVDFKLDEAIKGPAE